MARSVGGAGAASDPARASPGARSSLVGATLLRVHESHADPTHARPLADAGTILCGEGARRVYGPTYGVNVAVAAEAAAAAPLSHLRLFPPSLAPPPPGQGSPSQLGG
eukprot:4457565-Pyramimonas_sp.AAC.1